MFIKTKLTRIITFGFASAITLFPFVLVRHDIKLQKSLIRHERIHLMQQKELLILPFFILYFFDYLLRLFYFRNHHKAYRNICFEKEAYCNESNPYYQQNRKHFNWLCYL